jgi:hypothetical protein
MPLGKIDPVTVKMSEGVPAEPEPSTDACHSDGWGEESARDEQAIRFVELKQALRELVELLFNGTSLASLMGFIIAASGFIRLLSFTNIWQDAAILGIGLAIFGIFRRL